jgi:hypothetical protein
MSLKDNTAVAEIEVKRKVELKKQMNTGTRREKL